MAHLVRAANFSIDKEENAFRMELARLHETVVDLKMQLASARADLKNHPELKEGGEENSSSFKEENGENIRSNNTNSTKGKEDSSKLTKVLNSRVQALSKELITAESKNKKLLRMLESTKKQAKRQEKRKRQ